MAAQIRGACGGEKERWRWRRRAARRNGGGGRAGLCCNRGASLCCCWAWPCASGRAWGRIVTVAAVAKTRHLREAVDAAAAAATAARGERLGPCRSGVEKEAAAVFNDLGSLIFFVKI